MKKCTLNKSGTCEYERAGGVCVYSELDAMVVLEFDTDKESSGCVLSDLQYEISIMERLRERAESDPIGVLADSFFMRRIDV